MKKILITGAGSYIGTSVENHLGRWPDRYSVDTLDMMDQSWQEADFSPYDAVLHVAGIVHQSQSKNDPRQAELYDRVNTRLAVETARKAKQAGVKQFLFLSSASVYGLDAPLGHPITITRDTPLTPRDNYGISKKKAEEGLTPLAGEGFRLAILRPPMIYGKNCRGNYPRLSSLARKLPLFPYVENERSMLYIGNLAEFIRLLIDDEAQGIFCPQDREYVNTCRMVEQIARCHGKRILLIPGFTWALKLLRPATSMVDKAFGSLCYDRSLSDYPREYCLTDVEQAIRASEGV